MLPAHTFSQSVGPGHGKASLESDQFGRWEGVWEGLPRSTVTITEFNKEILGVPTFVTTNLRNELSPIIPAKVEDRS